MDSTELNFIIMKRFFPFLLVGTMFLFVGCHKNIWNSINDLQSRVEKLEILCGKMNTNIDALQTILNAQGSGDVITNVSEIQFGGATIGYTITFTSGKTITLYNGANGKDGADGKDGYVPSIGVAKASDGIYYWTVDGAWLLDTDGNKLPVTNTKGEKGDSGKDGTDGLDGITPQLKIEENYWYISYDNGSTWAQLGKATGNKGDAGEKGDSMFSQVTQDSTYVYFTLSDGTIIKIAKDVVDSDTEHTDSDIIDFKDLYVKRALLFNDSIIDMDGDGEISYGEAAATRRLIISDDNMTSFTELQFFTALTYLDIKGKSLFELTLPKTGIDTINCISMYYSYMRSDWRPIIIPNTCKCIGKIIAGNVIFAEGSHCNRIFSIVCNNSIFVLPDSVKYFTGPLRSDFLKELYCRPLLPPTIDMQNTLLSADGITIYVPEQSLSLYKSAWSNYSSKITGYDFEK